MKQGISLNPSITINNITYRGDVTGYDVFRAICEGFKSKPGECQGDNIFEILS